MLTFLPVFAISVLASQLGARQSLPTGPHGTPGVLIQPAEGQVFANPGPMTIKYRTTSGGGYVTQSIQVNVQNPGPIGGGPEANMLNGLQSLNAGTDEYIEALIATPATFCGDQVILVFETQVTPNGTLVQFLSASPTVHFSCWGGDYPPPPTSHSGPQGTLLSPSANTVYANTDGAGVHIHFQYERSLQLDAVTVSLALELAQSFVSYTLASALGPTGGVLDGTIEQYFAAPGECLCGTFDLVIDETQLYQGGLITFQTYSVPLQFDCPPEVVAFCSG
ncbi:hypothetical protein DACRYDRAFT_22316 [Dacryopinax primogenitus]|uniref:Uncharacterized protein n=1 Tax=Dacryopinax primogenitus (strain DJM 731) TaxID=1858805 RepID=M5GCN1_DACPD|nr:uncharacterized protein DACRYDRAFT_22316 [Dacryopinax primogenitus]EJU01873.1 hypothetical protein DACRYDRAFT_22316 [Dacryopinax primogenitus]